MQHNQSLLELQMGPRWARTCPIQLSHLMITEKSRNQQLDSCAFIEMISLYLMIQLVVTKDNWSAFVYFYLHRLRITSTFAVAVTLTVDDAVNVSFSCVLRKSQFSAFIQWIAWSTGSWYTSIYTDNINYLWFHHRFGNNTIRQQRFSQTVLLYADSLNKVLFRAIIQLIILWFHNNSQRNITQIETENILKRCELMKKQLCDHRIQSVFVSIWVEIGYLTQ